MHRFSIIVPMLDDRRLFDDTLASVLRYRPSSSQVIVAHDGTYDDPYSLGTEVDFVSTSSRANLVHLFNCALRESTGDYIALIRPGVELTNGWEVPVQMRFEDANVASVAPIVVSPAQPQTIIAAGVVPGFGFRRRIEGSGSKIAPRTIRRLAPLGPTSWAAFYRRSVLEQIGVCADQLDPLYLDADIALSLKTIGYECDFCPECIVQVERRILVERELDMPYGKSAQRAYRRHSAQSGSGSSLFRSGCAFAQDILLAPFQPWRLRHAIGRLGAWTKAGIDREYADHLWQLSHERLEHGKPAKTNHAIDVAHTSVNSSSYGRAA